MPSSKRRAFECSADCSTLQSRRLTPLLCTVTDASNDSCCSIDDMMMASVDGVPLAVRRALKYCSPQTQTQVAAADALSAVPSACRVTPLLSPQTPTQSGGSRWLTAVTSARCAPPEAKSAAVSGARFPSQTYHGISSIQVLHRLQNSSLPSSVTTTTLQRHQHKWRQPMHCQQCRRKVSSS